MTAVQTMLRNTWRGLIQRRLWPIAALLLATLVAVPVLLKTGPEPAPVTPKGAVAGESAELASQPLVAVASASERETLRRVLGRRKDPFKPTNQPRRKQVKTISRAAGEPKQDDTGSGAGTTLASPMSPLSPGAGTTPMPLPNPNPTPTPNPNTTPEEPGTPESGSADSLTVRWGSSEDEQLERSDLERLGALAAAEAPVVIYLGLTDNGRTAVFMVDAEASAQGDGRCRPDPSNCQTIELTQGETEFFDIEAEGGEIVQYQLDVVKIHRGKAGSASAESRTAKAAVRRTRTAKAAVRRTRTGKAAGSRTVLRALAHGELGFRYDERTGRLELLRDKS